MTVAERVDVGLGAGVAEREPQRASARARSAPIASSTWLGWATPAVQAEPVEQAMPLASSSISSASPSQPGNEKCALPGSRLGPGSGPFRIASGTVGPHHVDQAVPQLADRAGVLGLVARPPSSTATANPAIAAVSSVPERTSRSWPPPCSTGTGSWPRASSSAPAPTGPPILCPVIVSAVAPLARQADRKLTGGLNRVAVERDPVLCRDRGQLGDRLDRADLVVRPHHADQRHARRGRARSPRAASPG